MTDANTVSADAGNTGATSGAALLFGDTSGAGGGADTSSGGAGASTVQGSTGTDTVASGAGGDWLTGMPSDEARGFVQNKGWKSPADILTSYQNLEKLVGLDKVPLPKDEADAEGFDRLYKAVGRPDTPEGYQIKVGEGVDPAFASQAAKWMHEAGVGAKGAAKLVEHWNGYIAGAEQQAEQAFKAQTTQDMNGLQTEWGQNFNSNVELARRGAKQFGLDGTTLGKMERALGTKQMMTFLQKVGSGLAEDSFEGGDNKGGSGFSLTPEAAKARIAALKQDPEWSKRYLAGGATEKAEFERLQKTANPDGR